MTKVTLDDSQGKDEWYCTWYKCNNCDGTSLASTFKFCPNCGTELEWHI
jgi:hypothetical protein